MAQEIERRFLVEKDKLPKLSRGYLQIQGYLGDYPTSNQPSTRVRLEKNKAFLTLKWPVNNLVREEFEFEINRREGQKLLKKTSATIEKIRYPFILDGKKWEIDFFQKENFPLIIAEIELKNESEEFEKPLWIKREITGEEKLTSLHLAYFPINKKN